jgi:hypothetical protein
MYIVTFLLFVGLGIWSSFHFPFRDDRTALALTYKWLLLPSLILGGLYAFYGGYKRSPEQATWRKVLSVFALIIITTLMFLKSFQGFVFLINGYVGKQSDVDISGVIWKVEKPEKKKPLNTYTIHIKDKSASEIVLDVPGVEWQEGQQFSRNLQRGSLGILYGN